MWYPFKRRNEQLKIARANLAARAEAKRLQAENNARSWYAPACEAQKKSEGWNHLGRSGEWITIRNMEQPRGKAIPFKEIPAPFDYPRGVNSPYDSLSASPTVNELKEFFEHRTIAPQTIRLAPKTPVAIKKKFRQIRIIIPTRKQIRSSVSMNWQPYGPIVQFYPEKIGLTKKLWEKHYKKQQLEDSRIFL